MDPERGTPEGLKVSLLRSLWKQDSFKTFLISGQEIETPKMSSRNEDKHHEHRARRGLRVGALREQGRELQVEHDRISNQDLRTSLVAMLSESKFSLRKRNSLEISPNFRREE